MKRKKNNAFTLVELIVVITILAILGTIAFISLQGYSASSRDSVRISDVSNMKTSLELFHLNSGKYPLPDDYAIVDYGGEPLWYQGTFGSDVVSQLSRNLNEIPTDSLSDKEFIYSVANNKNEFQILNLLEGDLVLNTMSQTNAATTVRTPRIDGQYNGVFIKTATDIVPVPSLINAEVNGTGPLTLDTDISITSQITTGGKNIPDIGNINSATGTLNIAFSVYNGTINKDSLDSDKEAVMDAIQTAYTGSDLATSDIYAYILSKTTTDELVVLLDTIVLNSNTVVPTTPTYSCIGTVPTSNVTKTNDTGLTVDTEWQTDISGNDCYYECSGGFEGINCETEPPLITSTDCTTAGWIWVDTATDVYIGTTQGDGFCISPRFGDWNTDSNLGDGGISWNGWGNYVNDYYNGWDASSIDDTLNSNPEYGQTRRLDSEVSYNCKAIGTASSDYDITDTVAGRMKWLATTGNTYAQARSIDWITGLVPHTVGTNPHAIPALYIADCIDGVKDLGTDMDYKHYPDEGLNETITYAQYNTDPATDPDSAFLSDATYQDRQKYLTAWTQKTGSHLPSAMSYITTGFASASDADGDFLVTTSRGEYQVACEATKLTDANDDTDNERIWLSAVGYTTGTSRGRIARLVGSTGCGDQGSTNTGYRNGDKSARFVVRP